VVACVAAVTLLGAPSAGAEGRGGGPPQLPATAKVTVLATAVQVGDKAPEALLKPYTPPSSSPLVASLP
jgi:hypothetical protein